uniref:Alpha/beta hydrolase fold-3 domain-containing protein n=1 Tax=Ditylenchus dipsaci TaxID=166011 RepID=A0A915EHR1_9BILA
MAGDDQCPDLDLAFSCSYWTENNKLSPNEVIQNFIEFKTEYFIKMWKRFRINWTFPTEVLYFAFVFYTHYLHSTIFDQRLDLWGADEAPDLTSLLVYIHGGYWQEGDKSLSTSLVEPLVQHGICVAVVGYDLAPAKTIVQIAQQIVQALQWLTKRYPNCKLTVAGHSAGAHLAVKAIEISETDLKIHKLALFCGVYTKLEELKDTYIGKNIRLNLDTALEANVNFEKFLQNFSPGHILILNAEYDAPKIKDQKNWLEENLKSSSINFHSMTISNTNHFSIIEGLNSMEETQTKALLKFIKD